MDVMEAIRRRHSVREFADRPIPQATLEQVTEALRLAPSACNYQPWRFIIVTDPERRRELARACRSQNFIANAPAVIVGCALTDEAYARMGGYWSSSDIDVAIALDHLTLAATGAGLGTCWIGAFTEAEVKAVLDIPAGVKPVAIIIMGYPALESAFSDVPTGGRKPREQVFSLNKF